jgi:hypothetical protein
MDHLDPELLTAYIDDELSPADAAQVERHLASCETCAVEFRELRGISTLVRELPVYLPRREITIQPAPSSGSPTMARILEFSRPLAIAAVVLLVAFAGLRLLNDVGDDDSGGEQISFSAVQETTTAGTESAARASDTTAAEAPAVGVPSDEEQVEMVTDLLGQVADSEAPQAAVPEMAEVAEESAPTVTIAPTITTEAEPATATPEDDDSIVTAIIVVAVVILVGGAAGWYMLFRSPRGSLD